MKTSSTFPLPTLLLLFLSLGQFPTAVTGDLEILVPGVYIITMVSDPDGDGETRVILRINHQDAATFIAYGDDNVIAGLSAALPFKVGDFIGMRSEGARAWDSAVLLSIAFASSSKKYFTTVRSDGYVNGQNNVGFYSYITESGSWSNYHAKKYSFSVPRDGVYWIMARPDPPNGHWTTVNVKGFNTYTGYGVPTSASGAFYLTTSDEPISMKVITGESRIRSATMMSFVYLECNTPAKLNGTYMAITDTVPTIYARTYGRTENIAFGGSTILDRGGMYNKSSHVFNISITGTYILSLRGNPKTNRTLRLQLYRNNQLVYQSFSQRGVSSGQASVFDFDSCDTLYVRARGCRDVGKHTMISIALLFRKD